MASSKQKAAGTRFPDPRLTGERPAITHRPGLCRERDWPGHTPRFPAGAGQCPCHEPALVVTISHR